jgi:hypothetical protein
VKVGLEFNAPWEHCATICLTDMLHSIHLETHRKKLWNSVTQFGKCSTCSTISYRHGIIEKIYTDYYHCWWPVILIHDSELLTLVIIINILSNIKCQLEMFWLQVASLSLSVSFSTSGITSNKWQVRQSDCWPLCVVSLEAIPQHCSAS